MPTQTLKTVCNFVLPWLAGMILGDQEGITIRARPDVKRTRTHAAPMRTVRSARAVLLRTAASSPMLACRPCALRKCVRLRARPFANQSRRRTACVVITRPFAVEIWGNRLK